jgi:hypothetical protein
MMRGIGVLAALLLVAAAPPPPPESDQIIVQGRTEPMVRSYVEKVVKPQFGHQIARWNAPICVTVSGMADLYANYITQRIAVLAGDLKIPVEAKGCQPTVTIKMTDHADALAKALVETRPKRVGNVNNDTLLPASEIAAIEAPRTIRWLTASETVSNDGKPIGGHGVAYNYIYSPTLIGTSVREDVVAKLVLIDESKLSNVTLSQLADYIAFVVFTTPDLGSDFSGTDSILALFPAGTGTTPAGLTGQDRAFLAALYTTAPDRTAAQQKSAIRSKLKGGK